MTLHSQDRRSKFALEGCGAELATYPSICFGATVETPEVSGGIGELWFTLDEVHRFIDGLASLDERRSGNVRLESMSPDEFSLEVFALDRTGHLGLRVSISGRPFGDERMFPYSLSAGFEIDPTSLPHLAEALRADVQQQRAQTA